MELVQQFDKNVSYTDMNEWFYKMGDMDGNGSLNREEFFALYSMSEAEDGQRNGGNGPMKPFKHYWDSVEDKSIGMSTEEFENHWRKDDPEID